MSGLVEAYQALKGSRLSYSELIIPGLTSDQEYEEMLDYLLELLAEYKCIRRDYYEWLYQWADAYHKFRLRQRHVLEFYDPLLNKRPDDYTTQEQLAVIRFYLYRRASSKWSNQGEMEHGQVYEKR